MYSPNDHLNMFNFRFLRAFLLMFVCGCAAFSNAATPATPISVKLYVPENLDAEGKQIPNTRQITEIFNYLEREAGLQFVMVALPWKRAQLEVRKGSGIIYGFSKTSERLEHYRYSLPVITLYIWAISYGMPASNLSGLQDLKGKTIHSGLGLSHGLEYENAKNHVFSVQEDVVSDHDRFKRLILKPGDLMLLPSRQDYSRKQVDDFVNRVLIPRFKDQDLNDRHFDISINPIFFDTIHFAAGKKHFDEVLDKIDKAIELGAKNGALTKLLKEYQ